MCVSWFEKKNIYCTTNHTVNDQPFQLPTPTNVETVADKYALTWFTNSEKLTPSIKRYVKVNMTTLRYSKHYNVTTLRFYMQMWELDLRHDTILFDW